MPDPQGNRAIPAPSPAAAPGGSPPAPDTADALLAALPGQAAVVCASGAILAVNAGWRRFARENGLPGDPANFNYLEVCTGARGEGAAHARTAWDGVRSVLAGHAPLFTLDYPCHAPRQQRWLRMQVVPVRWRDQAAALVLHTDITTETIAAQSAAQAGAHLRAAETAAGFGTFRGAWTEGELRQVQMSRGLREMLGVPWQPQPLATFDEIWCAIGAEPPAHMQLALREFGVFHGGCVLRRGGQRRELQIHAHLVAEPHGESVLGVLRDVTEQSVQEAAQAQSRAVLQLAGVAVGSWTLDGASGSFVVSREVALALGLPPQSLVRRTRALGLFAPHHRALVLQSLRHGGLFDLEVQLQPRPRQLLWVRLTGEAAGGAGGLQGLLHVIDARRKLDVALRDTHQTLQLVSRCHEVLVRARDEAQLLAALCAAAVAAGDYRGAWIAREDNGVLCPAATAQMPEGLLASDGGQWGRSAVRMALRRRRLQYVPDLAAPKRYGRLAAPGGAAASRGLVAVPLVEGDTVLGALVLYLDAGRALSEDELETLAHVGRDAGYAIATLRGRAQQALTLARVAEQAEILDKAHDAIIVCGLDKRVLYWNRGAEHVYGWTAVEALGRDVRELVRTETEAFEAVGRQLLRDGSAATELRVRPKDGSPIWIHATWTLLRGSDERPDRVLAICTDITLRKTIAEALSRSRAMLEAGHALARLAGVEIDHATGRVDSTCNIVDILGLPQPPRSIEDLAAGMAPGSAQALLERLRAPDGQGFELELEVPGATVRRWVRALCAAAGAVRPPAVTTLVFQDITAIRGAREEILRLNASLERRVQGRTRQLEEANRELEAFSYSVSHDLKAPLAAIDGFTHVLAERLEGRLEQREAGYMQRVRAGVANMFALIDAMLGLHQLARGAPLRRRKVDVSALAARIVAELREAEPERPCDVRIAPDLHLFCDGSLMATALRNLIGNSWKFSARKPGVDLEIAADAEGPEGFATLRICDRGAGFDQALAHRLFAPFQRLHHATEFAGTGVGLATVHRIVQRHGGMIRAQGRPDAGATFWLSLPLRAADDAMGEE